jgi:drug/metabolite transporter (DMT)-like permease
VALGLAAALIASVVFGTSAVLQAVGARKAPAAESLDPRLYTRLLQQPAFVAALVLNLVGFVLHLVAVRLLPLFLAQAGIAASLMVTALLAVRVFGDRLVLAEWAAVVAVCVGLALLTAAAGEAGDERATTALNVALALGVMAIAAGAAVATRSTSVLATTLLSMFAGLGFATTAISARLLPELSVLSLLSAPATYVLGAAGALAFLTYSVALQRGAVTAATAPMIVMQTVVPALLGIAVLGDMVRSGWLIGAGFGFVATVAGAVTLARYEGLRAERHSAAAASSSTGA